MSRRPSIPERYSSLMSEDRQKTLRSKQRDFNFSQTPAFSRLSAASSTVSEFLEDKIESYQLEIDYLRAYKDGLHEVRAAHTIDDADYKTELHSVLDDMKLAYGDLQLIKRQRNILQDNLEDELWGKRRKDDVGPDQDFLERAEEFAAYCHLTGWEDSGYVKAAYLVPKSLAGEEIGYLFKTKELVRFDPRSGISLHSRIEAGLDDGSIAIVPVPEDNSGEGTRWKCILVDDSRKKLVCLVKGDTLIRWEDLDGKELTFLTSNRPSRRFLCFRFIVTYLHAKNSGNTSFIEKVEDRARFWASPGPYLQYSTLISLARNICGCCELPPSLLEDTTFKSADMEDDHDDDINIMLSVQLREAIMKSTT
ncbi:hypothetical protein DTO169E5_6406 [Paecilomyces variotii]|nr:hypothetical protein DTO169E5_6406 [Paecilomyces variotii]